MTDDTAPEVRVGGRYVLGELLGQGGMAEVRHGTDVRLGRTVAVKRLRTDLATDPTFQARFRREAQAAAGLNHPNIVSVYDTGEEMAPDGSHVQPYIVMEYVQGRTLREVLNDGRKLLPERALEITAGVLAALDYSHRAGIVHRDIKPANVMLTPTGDVKVMDFGIARAIADGTSTMTQTSAVVGTAQYLSPEQARGETVDSRSDVYSTGCLLYELLTGRPPFVGDSPFSVAYQHVREVAEPPRTHNPELPEELDAITMKALAKKVEDRYQSAAEMRADIQRYLDGQPVDAPTAVVAAAPVVAAAEPGDLDLPPLRRRAGLRGGAAEAALAAGARDRAGAGAAGRRHRPGGHPHGLGAGGRRPGRLRPDAQPGPPHSRRGRARPRQRRPGALRRRAGPGHRPGPRRRRAGRRGLRGRRRDLRRRRDHQRALPAGATPGPRPRRSSTSAAWSATSRRPTPPRPPAPSSAPTPNADTPIEVGGTVTVVLSLGPIEVPGVVGRTEDQARAILDDAGLEVEVVEDSTTPSEPGQVLDAGPGRRRRGRPRLARSRSRSRATRSPRPRRPRPRPRRPPRRRRRPRPRRPPRPTSPTPTTGGPGGGRPGTAGPGAGLAGRPVPRPRPAPTSPSTRRRRPGGCGQDVAAAAGSAYCRSVEPS